MSISSWLISRVLGTAMVCSFLVAVAGTGTTAIAQQEGAKSAEKVVPTFPQGFVGNPEFFTKQGNQTSGTASVVKSPDGKSAYIITARHLLGPSGGFPKKVPAADVPAAVQKIVLTSLDGGLEKTYLVKGIAVPDLSEDGSVANDLALYKLPDGAPPAFAGTLAAKEPAVGDRLWIIARVRGGAPEGQMVHSGKVVEVETMGKARIISMLHDNQKIIANGASGSPALNAAGEVVGIFTGGSDTEGNKQAYLLGSATIRKAIEDPASFAQMKAAEPAAAASSEPDAKADEKMQEHFAAAQKAMGEKNYVKAEEELTAAEACVPSQIFPVLHVQRGIVRINLMKYKEAEEDFTVYIDNRDEIEDKTIATDVSVFIGRSTARLQLGDYEGAAEDIRLCQKLEVPENRKPTLLVMLGQALYCKGKMDEAAQAFESAAKYELKEFPLLQISANVYLWTARARKGDEAKATADLAAFMEKRRSSGVKVKSWPDVTASFLIGKISAADMLTEAETINEGGRPAVKAERVCQTYFYIAAKALGTDKEAARKALQKCVESKVVSSLPDQAMGRADLKRLESGKSDGGGLYDGNAEDDATAGARQGKSNPEYEEHMRAAAKALKEKDLAQAEVELDLADAKRLGYKASGLYLMRGGVRLQLQNFKGCEEDLTTLLNIREELKMTATSADANIYLWRGMARLATGRHAEAVEDIRKCQTFELPELQKTLCSVMLGTGLYCTGDLNGAIQAWQQIQEPTTATDKMVAGIYITSCDYTWVANTRLGKGTQATDELKASLLKIIKERGMYFPVGIGLYLAGNLPADRLLAVAEKLPDPGAEFEAVCQAHYFTGARLASTDPSESRKELEKCLESKSLSLMPEKVMAAADLKRMDAGSAGASAEGK